MNQGIRNLLFSSRSLDFRTLPGATLWFRPEDANVSTGSTITTLIDRVGGHAATQATESQKPLYIADKFMRFDGLDDFLSIGSSPLAVAPAQFSFFTVVRMLGDGVGTRRPWSNNFSLQYPLPSSTTSRFSGTFGGGGITANIGETLFGQITLTECHWDGSNLYPFRNGAPQPLVAAVGALATAGSFFIGAGSSVPANTFNGDVGEIFISTAFLPESTRIQVRRELQKRYVFSP